jgi:5'-nucleotidase
MRRIVAPLLLLAGCGLPSQAPPTRPVRFLLVNDVYVADTLSDGTGGVARVSTLRRRIADEGPVLFMLAGDVLSPSVLSKYHNGRQMVESFNAAMLDYATFGNHEFELPRDTLLARIGESKFKWISTNCTERGGAPLAGVLPWDTVRVQGYKIGIFGLTLQGDYRAYVHCGNPDSAATRAVDTLSALGADMVVGLTHQSVAADRALLSREGRIDLILGGHEHEAHDTVAGTRHVVKADANARSAQSATLWGGKGQWREATRLITIDGNIPADTAVARVVDRWRDSLKQRLGAEQVVGTTPAEIDGRDEALRHREMPFGDLITDAIRSGTGADVALINSGTLRLDDVIRAGPITNYQLESIFLFPDETRIVTFPLTGARLRELLERSVSDSGLGRGAFLQVSGLQLAYDPSRPSGQRITSLTRTGGAPIKPTDQLNVAFDVYPACQAGDGYRVPEAQGACASAASGPRAADLIASHIRQHLGGVVRPPEGERIVRK